MSKYTSLPTFPDLAIHAKWLKAKVRAIKVITDNYGLHTPFYQETILKFKQKTGIEFKDAEQEIKKLWKEYFSQKDSIPSHPSLFTDEEL